ncbi:MAG: ornithine carbamoyltransferase [Acidimicrobiia bacterium]|nr:ornithine carbamoyltransferase [Acidimicrobiia bacterium]
MRHFLDVDDLAAPELVEVLDRADRQDHGLPLHGKGVALLFAKPSLRTRHSCEMGVIQLGGHPVSVRPDEIGVNDRETPADIARVLAGYHALLGARVFAHADLVGMAEPAAVPVINLLSDDAHPCQALTDLLTMRQVFGELQGRTVAWIGDHNNVARSLALGASLSGMALRFGCPEGYGPSPTDIDQFLALGALDVTVVHRPEEAAKGADAVHTDVWTSMGFEAEADDRDRAFEGFMVDDAVMAGAHDGAVFMHCLPAHRGEEVSATVIDGPASVVIQQAHNRLHAFRALAWWLAEENHR